MNKTKLTYIVVALLIILSLGLWYLYGNSGNTGLNQPGVNENLVVNGSLADVMNRGGSYVCELNQSLAGGAEYKGKIYTSGKKLKGDFEISYGGSSTKNHMISDGEYNYIWTDEVNEGAKIKIDTSATTEVPGQPFDSKLDYHCQSWIVNQSFFELPTGITFN